MVKTRLSTKLKQLDTPLTWRIFAFTAVFILISGVIGPRIISGGVLYKDHFAIYAQLGKGMLFAAITFGLIVYRSTKKIKLLTWNSGQLIWLMLALLVFIFDYAAINHLLKPHSGNNWLFVSHAGLILCLSFSALGCFGFSNLRLFMKTYKRELLLSLTAGLLFLGFLQLVYASWQLLAGIVLHSVHWLLRLAGLHSVVLPPRTLLFDKFGINIAEYCSGIESIALFTALYALIGLLDWPRFNHRRFITLFFPGLFFIFIFNILRVAILILAGYYINPQIAFSLFHTYAGMVFFIIYSALFWAICYKLMLLKPSLEPAKHTGKSKQI